MESERLVGASLQSSGMLNLDLVVQPWGASEGFGSGQWSSCSDGGEEDGAEEVRDWNNLPSARIQAIENAGTLGWR